MEKFAALNFPLGQACEELEKIWVAERGLVLLAYCGGVYSDDVRCPAANIRIRTSTSGCQGKRNSNNNNKTNQPSKATKKEDHYMCNARQNGSATVSARTGRLWP
jgi:hypothetical protein